MNHENLTTKDSKKAEESSLFDRVVQILEQTRANVVRAVNSSMVTAYWLIGREIVLELQGGDERAEYGKQVIEKLSRQLTQRYGGGYSVTNLQYFRKFYQAYSVRSPIAHPVGAESSTVNSSMEISRPMGAELTVSGKKHPPHSESIQSFSPQLSWSHYRALMRIAKPDARDFYEREAIECGWDKRTLERQIHSHYYQRMLVSQSPQQMIESARREISPRKEGIDVLNAHEQGAFSPPCMKMQMCYYV